MGINQHLEFPFLKIDLLRVVEFIRMFLDGQKSLNKMKSNDIFMCACTIDGESLPTSKHEKEIHIFIHT